MGAGNSTAAAVAKEKEFTTELLKELREIEKTDIPRLQKMIENVPKLITKLEEFEKALNAKGSKGDKDNKGDKESTGDKDGEGSNEQNTKGKCRS